MATSIGSRDGRDGRESSAKLAVADQISQSLQSTANVLHLMHQSSPSQAQLMKLSENLLAKTSTIENTKLVLEHMPRVISSLEENVETGLRSAFYEILFEYWNWKILWRWIMYFRKIVLLHIRCC